MDKERKLIIAGNWKMNKTVAESLDLANGLVRELKEVKEVDIAICLDFEHIIADFLTEIASFVGEKLWVTNSKS